MHAEQLLSWYAAHGYERGLPWRVHGESLDRVAMVEGLLAQTRAGAVAAHYERVFDGVCTAADWLALRDSVRVLRVAPLGLPALKAAAVTSIAEAVAEFPANPGAVDAGALRLRAGLGPYTAAMVALLYGRPGVPVDANVERVGQRVDGDPERWIAEVVEDAIADVSVAGRPPGYEAVCAVLDVGARVCHPEGPECHRCPLQARCASWVSLGRQRALPIATPHAERYVVATLRFGGVHHWGSQPADADRAYLSAPHRHEFHVEVGLRVGHADRDVEILALKQEARLAIEAAFGPAASSAGDLNLREASCEMLADIVLKRVAERFAAGQARRPESWCRVLEDGENGAVTYWGGR